jgi:hypothetical protein
MRDAPRLRQTLAVGPPLDRRTRRRTGSGLGQAQGGIVGQCHGDIAQRQMTRGKGHRQLSANPGRPVPDFAAPDRPVPDLGAPDCPVPYFAVGKAMLHRYGAHSRLRTQPPRQLGEALASTGPHNDHPYLRHARPVQLRARTRRDGLNRGRVCTAVSGSPQRHQQASRGHRVRERRPRPAQSPERQQRYQ